MVLKYEDILHFHGSASAGPFLFCAFARGCTRMNLWIFLREAYSLPLTISTQSTIITSTQTKEPGAVSLWAFLHFVVLLRTDRGGPQQRIGNISRPAAAETCPPGRAKMEKGRFRMYDRKCDVDIRLLGCALVLLVMALLTIHTGLAKKAVTAAADPAPAAVVSTQDTGLSEDAGSVRYTHL